MKNNKKGFTLAELLIVIAIIAILIAIAIPTFSTSLRQARLQTDHANIRSAYALYQTAKMTGVLDDGTDGGKNGAAVGTTGVFFQKDGSVSTAAATAYTLQVKANSTTECTSSAGCKLAGTGAHDVGKKIKISYGPGAGVGAANEWKFEFAS